MFVVIVVAGASRSLHLVLLLTGRVHQQRLDRGRVLRGRRQRVGRGLGGDAGVSRDRGSGVGGGGGVRGGGVEREGVLELKQLVVRVERRGRAVPALVRRAHHVAAIGEAAHVGRRVVVRVAGAHYALVAFGALGVDVGKAARGEARRAVPLLAPVSQVVFQAKRVASVKK